MALPREVTVLSGVFEMATRSDQKVIPLTSGSILFEIPGGKGWALIQMRGAGGTPGTRSPNNPPNLETSICQK